MAGMQRDRPDIGLVGLGNIGFRHLQGLAHIAGEISVKGHDPSPAAVAKASAFWDGLPDSEGRFETATHFTPAAACILATPADGRLELLDRILAEAAPSVVLLEKVVFNRPSDFDAARRLLNDRDVRAYVNCPRRLWPVYQHLRAQLRDSGPIAMTVEGRGIGLACNTVHYLDLLQFLTGEQAIRADNSALSAPWESKRPGFFEVWGAVTFSTSRGDTLQIRVLPEQDNDAVLSVAQDGRVWTLSEPGGALARHDGEGQQFGRPPYQSELSGIIVSGLLTQDHPGGVPLSSFEESAAAHAALFESLNAAFNEAGLLSNGRLPIT